MGTNFYLGKDEDVHIGKRSAAGPYCWDCGITLCKGRVHYGDDFYDACPKCGNKQDKEPLESSAAGRELGFNDSKPAKKAGVRSCSSFTWDILPQDLWSSRKHIYDEYGERYSRAEFQEVLDECPIQFFDSIGHDFS